MKRLVWAWVFVLAGSGLAANADERAAGPRCLTVARVPYYVVANRHTASLITLPSGTTLWTKTMPNDPDDVWIRYDGQQVVFLTHFWPNLSSFPQPAALWFCDKKGEVVKSYNFSDLMARRWKSIEHSVSHIQWYEGPSQFGSLEKGLFFLNTTSGDHLTFDPATGAQLSHLIAQRTSEGATQIIPTSISLVPFQSIGRWLVTPNTPPLPKTPSQTGRLTTGAVFQDAAAWQTFLTTLQTTSSTPLPKLSVDFEKEMIIAVSWDPPLSDDGRPTTSPSMGSRLIEIGSLTYQDPYLVVWINGGGDRTWGRPDSLRDIRKRSGYIPEDAPASATPLHLIKTAKFRGSVDFFWFP